MIFLLSISASPGNYKTPVSLLMLYEFLFPDHFLDVRIIICSRRRLPTYRIIFQSYAEETVGFSCREKQKVS